MLADLSSIKGEKSPLVHDKDNLSGNRQASNTQAIIGRICLPAAIFFIPLSRWLRRSTRRSR